MYCGWWMFSSPPTTVSVLQSTSSVTPPAGCYCCFQPPGKVLSSFQWWCSGAACDPYTMTRDYVFVINPKGGNGKTAKLWKEIYPKVTVKLGDDWNVREAFTSCPSHATEITREAIRKGAAAVIAVGGDGTLHEVVNGFFEDGQLVEPQDMGVEPRTALGLIPLGTGSDFARTFNWKNNSLDAVERIGKGQRQKVDVGQVVLPEGGIDRYFLNVADIHLSAKGGYYAAKYKKLGTFCYVAGALHGFTDHKNQDLEICVDGGEWELLPKVTTVAVGNAKYFGGGMKITPTADPFSNKLEVVILQKFKWHDFVLKASKLYDGRHLEMKNVSVRSVATLEIRQHLVNPKDESKNKIFIQADGEHLGYLPAKICVLPGVIDFLV